MKLIIDTDIGDDIDDAYALVLAATDDEIEIKGVTTVYRNSAERAKIAAGLLCMTGKDDVTVAAGEDCAYSVPYVVEPFENLGSDGKPHIPQLLDSFKKYTYSDKNAVDFINEIASRYPNEVTLLELAPATNAARAFQKSPESFRKLKNIVMMGGQSGGTFAEWNIRCDPEAAAIVLGSGVDITLIGIDVTKNATLTDEEEKRLMSADNRALKACSEMLFKMHNDRPNRATCLHDVVALAEFTENFCKFRSQKTVIPTGGELWAKTVESADGNMIKMAVGFDRAAFMQWFFEKTDKLNKTNK